VKESGKQAGKMKILNGNKKEKYKSCFESGRLLLLPVKFAVRRKRGVKMRKLTGLVLAGLFVISLAGMSWGLTTTSTTLPAKAAVKTFNISVKFNRIASDLSLLASIETPVLKDGVKVISGSLPGPGALSIGWVQPGIYAGDKYDVNARIVWKGHGYGYNLIGNTFKAPTTECTINLTEAANGSIMGTNKLW